MSLVIEAGRRRVEITRPEKALFPCGITKAELAGYYEQIADVMLPHLKGRPLNLERYPDGIEGGGSCSNAPAAISRRGSVA